jgi:hypothetical protein
MPRIALPVALALLPALARAHDGPHLHPHGAAWPTGAMVAALAAGAAWLLLARR